MSLDRRGSPRPAWPKRGEPLTALPDSIDAVERMLAAQGYVAARSLATVLFLSLRLGRPLFLEGEAGVGKTEIAKVLAAALGRRLIRLQCYEGLDAASAVASASARCSCITFTGVRNARPANAPSSSGPSACTSGRCTMGYHTTIQA